MANADITSQSWDVLPDDSKWILESMARLGFVEFGTLSTSDQSLVIGFALHLKRVSQRSEIFQA